MTRFIPALCLSTVRLLAGCGGGDTSVGGTLSGLPSNTSVTLQLNGEDDTTVSANGSVSLAIASNGVFAFPGILADGTAYSVTVAVQPSGRPARW